MKLYGSLFILMVLQSQSLQAMYAPQKTTTLQWHMSKFYSQWFQTQEHTGEDFERLIKLKHAHTVELNQLMEKLIKEGADPKKINAFSCIHFAAHSDNVEALQNLIQNHNENVDALDRSNKTPLFYAARNGSKAAALFLLASGANVNHRDNSQRTPLMSADAVIAEELARNGANLEDQEQYDGYTPLICAILRRDMDTTQALLALGANVNNTSQIGSTPLMFSAQLGALGISMRLLEWGADPLTVNNKNMSALDYAAQGEVKHVLNNLSNTPGTFSRVITHALKNKDIILIHEFLKEITLSEESHLFTAIRFKNPELFEFLVDELVNNGVLKSESDKLKWQGFGLLSFSLLMRNFDALDYLIKKGLSPVSPDNVLALAHRNPQFNNNTETSAFTKLHNQAAVYYLVLLKPLELPTDVKLYLVDKIILLFLK